MPLFDALTSASTIPSSGATNKVIQPRTAASVERNAQDSKVRSDKTR